MGNIWTPLIPTFAREWMGILWHLSTTLSLHVLQFVSQSQKEPSVVLPRERKAFLGWQTLEHCFQGVELVERHAYIDASAHTLPAPTLAAGSILSIT